MKRRISIKITGRVQGVFFREGAKTRAARLNLAGFARNEPDGSVLVVAEGEESDLQALLEWCSCGPEPAQVESVDHSFAEPTGLSGFVTE